MDGSGVLRGDRLRVFDSWSRGKVNRQLKIGLIVLGCAAIAVMVLLAIETFLIGWIIW